MPPRRLALEQALVAYYALIQAAHLVVLVRAAILLLTTGRLTYPSTPS